MTRSVASRFADKVSPEPNSGCWLWTGSVGSHGYGQLSIPGKAPETAHRVSYRLHNGEIPAGMLVCHKCDNPVCVNPDHLFLGAPQVNALDCKAKGRNTKGRAKSEHTRSLISAALAGRKLTPEVVAGFRERTYLNRKRPVAFSEEHRASLRRGQQARRERERTNGSHTD